MTDMDQLIKLLQTEVPSSADDLNAYINNAIALIERTCAALSAQLSSMEGGSLEGSHFEEIIKDFQSASAQLESIRNTLEAITHSP